MKIAVIGAGAIGLTHCETITSTPGFELAGISDPSESAGAVADRYATRHYRNHLALLEAEKPEGVIVATPNELHVSIAVDFLRAGIPALVEKPLANSIGEAVELLHIEKETGVPVLVGHHRRHHPRIRHAHALISSGAIGRPVMVNVSYNLFKPDSYFEAGWRRKAGVGGPFLINAIHEIDLLRYLYGEIDAVSAMASNATRGFEVEDTGAILFHFANGALGAITVSDTAVGPWSWDLASGDVPRFPRHEVSSHRFSGTDAALTLPTLHLWRHDGEKAWTTPMKMEQLACEAGDPFVAQLRNFGDVIEGRAAPHVPAIEGARDMAVLEAVLRAVETGKQQAVEAVSI